MPTHHPDPAGLVTTAIQDFIEHSPLNTLKNPENDRAWEDFLLGFARGDDPLWAFLKSDIGPDFFWTPEEAFAAAYPDAPAPASELTVIAYVLPLPERTKAANRRETFYPADRWARGRVFGEEANEHLRRHVETTLREAGIPAVAPILHPQWARMTSAKYGFASRWSERHAAHVAGLGTFGLCDGLITPKGKAVRIGSVIARVSIPATPRAYTDHHAWCLHFAKGVCGKCVKRCPAGALSKDGGHDKIKCRAHIHDIVKPRIPELYGFPGFGCGLCQTGVPCESTNPTAPKAK